MSEADADANPLRIGILGAAAIAPHAIVKPARTTKGVSVVTVGARDPQRAQNFAQRHEIARAVCGYDAVLDDPDVDAVYIPLPNGLHGAWTLRAIDAGKHVLCEKPFTANGEEAARVALAADASDRVVMEAFHWRYHPLALRVIELLQSDAIGAIHHIDAAFTFPLLKRSDIRWDPTLAGGSLMDAGCYPLHQIRTVGHAAGIGEPVVDHAHAAFTARGVDRAMTAHLRFGNGTTAKLTCGMLRLTRPVDIHLHVRGARGSITAVNPILAHVGGHLWIKTTDPVTGATTRRREFFSRTPSYTYQLRAFVDAIRHHTPFPTTANDAVATMELIDAIAIAAGTIPARPTQPSQ